MKILNKGLVYTIVLDIYIYVNVTLNVLRLVACFCNRSCSLVNVRF